MLIFPESRCFQRAALSIVAAGMLTTPVAANHFAPHSWTGLYAGAHIGYHDADVDGIFDTAGSPPFAVFGGYDLEGVNGGLQVGADWQTGNFVIGVKGDYTWAGDDDSFIDGEGDRQELELGDFATIRARFGTTANIFNGMPALLYASIGAGWAELDLTVENGDDKLSIDEWGLAYGGGTEIVISEGVTLFSEYLVIDIDEKRSLADLSDGDDDDFLELDKIHTFRVGLNIRTNALSGGEMK